MICASSWAGRCSGCSPSEWTGPRPRRSHHVRLSLSRHAIYVDHGGRAAKGTPLITRDCRPQSSARPQRSRSQADHYIMKAMRSAPRCSRAEERGSIACGCRPYPLSSVVSGDNAARNGRHALRPSTYRPNAARVGCRTAHSHGAYLRIPPCCRRRSPKPARCARPDADRRLARKALTRKNYSGIAPSSALLRLELRALKLTLMQRAATSASADRAWSAKGQFAASTASKACCRLTYAVRVIVDRLPVTGPPIVITTAVEQAVGAVTGSAPAVRCRRSL